jgi:hypothetical protein
MISKKIYFPSPPFRLTILSAILAASMLTGTAGAVDSSQNADLAFNQEDLDFILKQIKFAERHAAGEELIDILPNATVPWGLRTVDGSFNNIIPGQETNGQAGLEFPVGVVRSYPDAQTLTFSLDPSTGEIIGDPTSYLSGNGKTVQDSTPRLISHLTVNQSVGNPAAVFAMGENPDAEILGPDITGVNQINIPNVAPDEGLSAPFNAFMTFFGQFFDHGLDLVNKGGNGFVFIPLQADDPLFDPTPGAPNFMVLKRATLDAGPDGIIGTADDVSNPVNANTPHVDQQQTYASHSSSQVLLRHYEVRDGRLQNTGRLINGFGTDGILDNLDDGGMGTWDTVQLQALEKFGIILDDFDGDNVPLILADPYGNFIPGPARGLPQLVTSIDPLVTVEGNVDVPVDATQALRIGQSFFLDVAHSANPNGQSGPLAPDPDSTLNVRTDDLSGQTVRGIRADAGVGFYDDELLGVHFACGDGRCNENIALTTIHSIFHREHNRLVDLTKRVILDSALETGNLALLNEWLDTALVELPPWAALHFPANDASLAHQAETHTDIEALNLDWNGQRLFQSARFGTEMQYNRVVFDEFVPTLAGLKDAFSGFHSNINPNISAEFSQSVYRFGHSMLTGTVDRYDANFNTIVDNATASGVPDGTQLGLFEAFLNPLALYNSDANGVATLDPEVAAGAVIRGITRTRANEIDEFVDGSLQNNLVGLPLDLGALNIARGRDVGNPSLNSARRMIFADTLDPRLMPYIHWVDYLDNLRHEPSIVNFIAAYGTHPTLAGADGIVGNADDPVTTFADRRKAACAIVGGLTAAPAQYCVDTGFIATLGDAAPTPGDSLNFLFSTGIWANDPLAPELTTTGLDNVDFWNGGLAEERMPFGGYLGSTHNFVFENQMESLQNGDRFYYLGRTANIHLLAELESNSFTALVMRNTDLGLPGAGAMAQNIFSVPNHILEVDQAQQFDAAGPGTGTADPVGDSPLIALVIRAYEFLTINVQMATDWLLMNFNLGDPNGNVLQYTGGDHVVLGGTPDADIMIGGIGDDTLRGGAGNDRLEGGDGADLILGGPGDDIITDLSGPDVIEGGDGNDAIASGNEIDIIFGDAGKDYIVNSSEFSEIFGGEGDDFILDGVHLSISRGGAGDDWMENLGGGEELMQGDNGAAPEAGEPTIKGNDVMINRGGNSDFDSENGDDIMVDGPGIERMEGQLGFDWASFQNDIFGVVVDLDLTVFTRPQLPPSNNTVSNRYDRIEGLSGSPLGDILRGTANALIGDNAGNGLVNFDLIDGLQDLVPAAVRGPLPPDPVTGEAQFGWTGGEIIIGGAGSDLMVGEGGNDIIDGDAALKVALEVREADDVTVIGLFDSMQDVSADVFFGVVNPGNIHISRVISDHDIADADTDAAVFTGNRTDYMIESDLLGNIADINGDGFVQISDTRAFPLNLPAGKPGNEGTDLVRNVERLQFADQTIVVPAGVAGSAGNNNNLAQGQPTISGTYIDGATLTASIASVTDADNVSTAGAVTGTIDWVWQVELEPESNFFEDILRDVIGNGDFLQQQGETLLLTANEIGLRIRVKATFQDENNVFEVVQSGPFPDADADGILDSLDNCVNDANGPILPVGGLLISQRDTDGDGFGNVCDTDLNQDGITNLLDVGIFRSVFLCSTATNPNPNCANADFNGDGFVNLLDMGVLQSFFLQPPG